jgi:lipoyl(octanoyl) transferase
VTVLPAPEWRVAPGLTDYATAVAAMEARAAAIRAGTAGELIWLVEHPPLYTAGTSSNAADLLRPDDFPVIPTGRGGKHTYHGPGQRVVYVMLDLDRRGRDIRNYVAALEGWIIAALAVFGVAGRAIDGKVGVWVETPAGAAKIAAIGVRVRRWVSFHGLAINVAPDLSHFAGIVPCGLAEPVTSLAALGNAATMAEVDSVLGQTLDAMLAAVSRHINHGA